MKLIVIGVLLFSLIYIVFKSLGNRIDRMVSSPEDRYPGFQYIDVQYTKVKASLKAGFYSSLSGLLLALLILLLFKRLPLLLVFLPISIYLFIQILVIISHLFSIQNIQYWYNTKSGDIIFKIKKDRPIRFNLYRDVTAATRIEAVQANRKLNPYFYKLDLEGRTVKLSFLYEDGNQTNTLLFKTIEDNFNVQTVRKLSTFI